MIIARGLRKRFGSLEVLCSLDASIERGRVTAIAGPNGAGKTTFIKSVLGLTHLDAGEILFDGVPATGCDGWRARVGYMPQIARFPANLTGAELFEFLRELRGVKSTDDSLIDALSLRPSLGKQLRMLSGGTRQKINAVAAFLFSPDLYILDEPTSGLDPESAGVMRRRILSERAIGRTIVIVSHLPAEIEELADHVVSVVDGRVAVAA